MMACLPPVMAVEQAYLTNLGQVASYQSGGIQMALLNEAGIHFIILDTNMSVMEGSIGILPRRVLVEEVEQERRQADIAVVEEAERGGLGALPVAGPVGSSIGPAG